MLTGEIRSQIDAIWNYFWSGGISNPMALIEPIDGNRNKKSAQTLALCVLCLVANASLAMDMRYQGSPNYTLRFEGEIQQGDYERLLALIRPNPAKFLSSQIRLSSEGGDLAEAIKIGELIKQSYVDVFVDKTRGACASACFFIYVSANQHDATERSLGIHRPYFSPKQFSGLTLTEAENQHRAKMLEVRAYLLKLEVPTYIIEKMFSLASTEIYWLTEEDIDRIGYRSNWWDQVLVSRCKANKSLEREATHSDRLQEPVFRAKYVAYTNKLAGCIVQISFDEGMNYLTRILATSKSGAKK